MSKVQHLDSHNFDLETADKTCIVDFWAEWCGPCRSFSAILEDIAAELPDDILIAKVNVDQNPDLAVRFQVRSIPAVFILKDGQIAQTFIGLQPKEKILQAVREA